MKQGTTDEPRLIRYLLGQMSAEEQEQIELKYLEDPEFHEELRAAERELIDRYVHGELPNPADFERQFLSSPHRRERVEVARALQRSLTRAPASFAIGNRAWLLAAAALVLLVGGGLVLNWQRQNRAPRVPQSARQQTGGGSAAPPIPPVDAPSRGAKPEVPAPRVVSLVLTPTLTRSADDKPPTLIIEGDAQVVRLDLHIEAGNYTRYRARVRTADGAEIWNQDRLQSERTSAGAVVVVRLPADRFTEQDYTIGLSGIAAGGEAEEVSSYYFRVQRK